MDGDRQGWAALPDLAGEAWVAEPGGAPRGAVVVGAEMFGVTGWIRGVCARLAGRGYVAAAPDLYWRARPRLELSADEEGRAAGRALMEGLRREDVLADVGAARELAASRAGRGGTGAVGFSLGGHVALLAATRLDLDLAVDLYGGWTVWGGLPLAEPVPPSAEAAAIAAHGTHVVAVVGADDFLVTAEEWDELARRLDAAGVAHEMVRIPGAGHGFMCDDRPEGFDAAAAADTWRRVDAALDRHVAA